MKNSNKILFTLSVFQMVSTSALTASSHIQQEHRANSIKEHITNQLIHTILDPKVLPNMIDPFIIDPKVHPNIINPFIIDPFNPLSHSSMIRELLNVHFSNHIQKRAIDNESIKLFNATRKEVQSLAEQQILSLFDEIIAYAVMPDATPEQLANGAKVITALNGSPHKAGTLYWASGKHPNATFQHVLIAAQRIHQMGRTYSRNAVWLILEECIRRNESLTYEELELAHQNIINITNFSGNFLNIAEFIFDKFPQSKGIAIRIIRNAVNKGNLNAEELEDALSMIKTHAPLDQSTQYRLTKRLRKSRM